MNEALIKKMTGRGTMSARFLHREWFDFDPTFKVWVDCNHKPVVRETSKAIWDRIKLIPFEVTFNEEEQDRHLPQKLLQEKDGILAWLVEGCFIWQKEGLETPSTITNATEAYRKEMDIVENFLDENCRIDPNEDIKASKLYQAFEEWCRN